MKQPAVLLVLASLAAAFGASPLLAQGGRGAVPEPGLPRGVRGTTAIVGRVVDPGTGSPVRGAEVAATREIGGLVSTTTDENGAYQLPRLVPGEWRVTASKAGFITWQYGQRRPFQDPPPISLRRDEAFTADIPLSRGGAISGRISNEFGEPVAGLHVRVYRSRMEQGARRLSAVASADRTDDTGAYRVYGLPPGDYYVAASLRVAPADSLVETTYSPTYYPGAADLAGAQRVRLGLGSEANATFALLPFRRARVSGLVVSSSGAPASAFLNLVSDSAEFGHSLGTGGVTRADGTFTIADVEPGRYMLSATLRGDGPEESGSIPVIVYGDDIAGATLVTGPPATLRGRFVADAGVSRRLPGGLEAIAFAERAGANVLGSGSGTIFEIDGLSEPFRLAAGELPDGWAVKQVAVNGMDATDAPVTLAPGQEGEARIVLTDRLTEVGGVVEAAGPQGGLPVVVFPADSSKWGYRSRYVRVTQTGEDGGFRITGLPPGDGYLAVATDYLDEGEHQDPEFLAAMQAAGVPFSLEEGGRRTVTVRLVQR